MVNDQYMIPAESKRCIRLQKRTRHISITSGTVTKMCGFIGKEAMRKETGKGHSCDLNIEDLIPVLSLHHHEIYRPPGFEQPIDRF